MRAGLFPFLFLAMSSLCGTVPSIENMPKKYLTNEWIPIHLSPCICICFAEAAVCVCVCACVRTCMCQTGVHGDRKPRMQRQLRRSAGMEARPHGRIWIGSDGSVPCRTWVTQNHTPQTGNILCQSHLFTTRGAYPVEGVDSLILR